MRISKGVFAISILAVIHLVVFLVVLHEVSAAHLMAPVDFDRVSYLSRLGELLSYPIVRLGRNWMNGNLGFLLCVLNSLFWSVCVYSCYIMFNNWLRRRKGERQYSNFSKSKKPT